MGIASEFLVSRGDAAANNLVHSAGRQVYKGGKTGHQRETASVSMAGSGDDLGIACETQFTNASLWRLA
jgi:hypothetical protein